MYDKRTFVLSSTLLTFFFIQTRSTSVNFFHLGCFQDNRTRAMPEMLGNWRFDSNAIQRCAQAAKRAGYLVFGVQYAGECWSGPLAHVTYKKYGTSTKCVNGTGGGWAQDLYRIVNASLIANYDVKRCYEVDITFHYRIQGGLTSSTITNTRKTFSDRFKGMSIYLSSLSECSHVTVTRKDIINSPPGVSSVFFRIPLMFTASTSVPDNEVSKELTVCIRTLSTFKQLLDSSSPLIKQGDMTYSTYNLSSISNKTSCCGGDIPPPCCGVGSIRINSTKCGCLPGFKFVPDSLCVRCPSDTYQNKQGQRSCKKCAAKKQTFGKTGMTSESNCSDTNPLQLSDQVVYLPYDIKSETLVTNVTVTGRLESLVQPLLFYMENVTQQQLSRSESKRKRRDIDDFCEGAGTVKPMSYFCVHRLTGGIEVTDDFQFKNGDDFDVKIRVTDSDQWGKTENTAKIKFISRDNCKEIRAFYKDASKGCPKNASSAKGLDSCPSKECLRPLFDWLKRLNSSEMLLMECSSDPHNLANLARIYSKCIGPPVITVAPNPQTVKRGAKVILKCNASSSLPLTVMWFKNGMPIGQSGSQLKIDSFQYGDQGDYYCRFSTYLTSRPTASALVTMKDTLTSRVSFRIVNEKFKDYLLNPRSSSYSDMQITIERKLLNYLNSGNPGWNYVVKLVKFRDSFNKVGVDLVIYSSATNEDIVPYYSKLEALLADKRTMDNILQPLKVSRNSVTIRSATHCLSKETGKKSIMGIFEWQLTVIGGTSSPVSCPYGPPAANATRPCGGNFTTGGMWKSPDVSLCKFKSERTNKLNNIAKTKVNKQNAAKVTKEVKVLTSDPDDMNEADAVLIADVIDSVVLLDDSLNETAQDVVDVVDNVMKMKKKDLQESQRTSKSSSKFIRALDKVARNLPLSEGKNSRRLIAPSVAIQSNRVDPGSFTGMSLAVKPPTADPNKLTSDNMVNDELPMADVQTSITLPEVIFENKAPSGKAVKIGFVIYQNDKFFQPVLPVDEESGQVNSSIVSRVISSSVKDMTIENLTKPVELVFEPAVEVDTTNGESVCAFWDFDAMGGLGNWSDRGCRQVKIEAGRILCHCDHMTNFAVLFSAGGPKKHVEEHAKALSIISYIGCAISLVGLTLTLMTYAMFRNLRKTNQQPILMSLCVSLMLLLIVFIAGAAQTENLLGCRIVAILLHYFALATVMWMGVEGYNMYMSFVQVMGTYQSKFMLKASAVAWGVPAITVLVTLSAATSYYGNKDVCVLFGVPFQAAQFAPILLVILINFVVFILAIRALKHSGALVSAEKKSTSYLRARTSIAILLLLGLTWGFGALAVSSAQLIFDYLFCIFNSLQGFLIFYFHCLRHQEVRSQWKWFLLGKGLNFRPTETDSQTGYPRSNTQGKNAVYAPSSSLMMDKPPRKETVTFVAAESPPSLGSRPDVVPDQV